MDHAEATTEAMEEPSLSGSGADTEGVEATTIDTSTAQDDADGVDTPAAAADELVAPQSPPKPRLSLPALTSTLAPSPPPQVSPPRGATAPNKQLLLIKTSDSPSSLHSERARHQHTRKVTRDIAALDFLQNIPMKSETQPPAAAGGYAFGANYNYYDASRRGGEAPATTATAPPARVAFQMQGDGGSPQQPDPSAAEDGASGGVGGGGGLAGRRLPGFEAKIVGVPPLFRYRLTTRFPAASAVVRRWESMTAQQGLLDSRVFFSRGCGYPIAATTVIKYNGNETATASHHHHHGARKRFLSVGAMEPQSYDWRGKSYYRLLHATWAPCDRDRDSQDDHPSGAPYVANYLDDPEFRQGRHRHVVRGDKNIGPVVSSILLFVKPHELKEELNKKFREKHTWLHDHELSLSKIRNLKRETLTTGQRLNMEVATIALACVYFEKLVLSHYVNKANRKLYMSVCLLLAAKFNEPKASDAMKLIIKQILAEIDATHSLPSREVLTIEFKIYAQLSFSLHVPLAELQPHFTRLLKLVESNPRKYLDEDVFNDYSKLVLEEKTVASRAQNDTVLSMDGETQDEGTDAEALMSDEDIEGDEGMEDDDANGGATAQRLRKESDAGRRRASLPPWSRMPSITQWWRERTQDGDQPIAAAARSHEVVDQDVDSKIEHAPTTRDTGAQ